MAQCPIKNKSWNKLVEQVGELNAHQLFVANNNVTPDLLKDLKLTKKEYSSLEKGMRLHNLRKYNLRFKSSHSIEFQRVGEANLYTISRVNYNWRVENKFVEKPKQKDDFIFTLREGNDYVNSEGDVVSYDDLTKDEQVAFNKVANEEGISQKVFEKIADKLKSQLKIDYRIITEEEADEIAPQREGALAFYYKGTTYFVEGSLSYDSVIHEFSHPFMRTIQEQNPKLYIKTLTDIFNTQEGQKIYQDVESLYPEYFKNGDIINDLAYEEIAVRALTAYAEKSYNKEDKGFISGVKNLIQLLKTMFKSVFGSKINLSKLNENTTLAELSDILLNENVDLEAKQEVEDTVYSRIDKDIIAYAERDKTAYTASNINLLKLHRKIEYKISGLEQQIKKLRGKKDPASAIFIQDLVDRVNYYRTRLVDLDQDLITSKPAEYEELILKDINDIIGTGLNYDLNNVDSRNQFTKDYATLLDYKGLSGNPQISSILAKPLADMEDIVAEYVVKIGNESLDLEEFGRDINISDLTETNADINKLEYLFEGVGDYARLEGQLIHIRTAAAKQRARTKTIKEGREIEKELIALQQWGKQNKMKLHNVYKLLVETSHTGKLDLVKPYTHAYYTELNNQFANLGDVDDQIVSLAKQWLRNNYYSRTQYPAYINPKYTRIQNTPELKRFYEFFQKSVNKGYDRLPDYIHNSNLQKIPSMVSEGIYKWMSVWSKLKDNSMLDTLSSIPSVLKNLLFSPEVKLYDSNGDLHEEPLHKELTKDTINLRYIGEIDPDYKSYDLGDILVKWAQFSHMYEEMDGVLPEIRMIQDIVSTKSYKNSKTAVNANTYKAIDKYIEAQITGDNSKKWGKIGFFTEDVKNETNDKIGIREYHFSDFVDNLMSYTRLLTLGFNPFSATANVLNGTFNNIIEANGGADFTKAELVSANNTFRKEIWDKNSKFNLLLQYFDPLQDLSEVSTIEAVAKSKSIKAKFIEAAYFMQTKGELVMQSILMKAVLDHKKVVCTDGETRSLYDLFYVDNGKIKFDKSLAGFDFDANKLGLWTNKIKKIASNIHGNYSKDNASVFNQHQWFQAAMMFKKWMPKAISERFKGKRYDFILGREVEGRIRTSAKIAAEAFFANPVKAKTYGVIGDILHQVITAKQDLQSNRPLSQMEISNLRKSSMEMSIMLLLALARNVLLPPPDDEDKLMPDWWYNMSYWDSKADFKRNVNPVLKFVLDQANRTYGELQQFYIPKFYEETVTGVIIPTKNPMGRVIMANYALAETLFLNVLEDVGLREMKKAEKQFVKGDKKGEAKFPNQLADVIPGVKPLNKLRQTASKKVNKYLIQR